MSSLTYEWSTPVTKMVTGIVIVQALSKTYFLQRIKS